MERLACLIVTGFIGDGVIQGALLRTLVAQRYAQGYIAWVRPQVASLFSEIPGCRVISSHFPTGAVKQFGLRATLDFLRAAREIRDARPSVTIDFIGDLRERLFAWLVGSNRHLHIGWVSGHPFNNLIRNPFGRGKPLVTIPSSVLNIYDAYDLMLGALVPSLSSDHSRTVKPRPARLPQGEAKLGRRVALHPLASKRSKLWPLERWVHLARRLIEADCDVAVFGAPSERVRLQAIFSELLGRISIITEPLSAMRQAVATMNVAVGLDSFFVHLAASMGARSIVLMGSNHPALWVPPNATVLSGSGGCKYYPCFNKPKCLGTSWELACLKSVSVETALSAVKVALDHSSSERKPDR